MSTDEESHQLTDDLTVDFELNMTGIFIEARHIFFWFSFWDYTELAWLDESDHVRAVDEAIYVWITQETKPLGEISNLSDDVCKLFVSCWSSGATLGDLVCELLECA